MENNLTFIGLMKKAGALAIGAEGAWDAVRGGKARLLLLAADAAKNTVKGANSMAAEGALLCGLPYTKAQLGEALGQKECAAFAVTNTGFALSLCQKIGFAKEEQLLAARLERETRRKKAKRDGSRQIRGKTHGCKQD